MRARGAVKWIVLMLLLVAAAALLAFGPRPDQEIPAGRTVVDYWEKWTGAEEQQMRSIVDEFNATVGKDKNIFVRYLSTSAVNQKTLIATAAGVPPDIAGLWDNNLVQFAELNALEPLEDLAAAAGITAATYKPVYWNACNYKGHLYGLVSTPMVVALFYNRVGFAQNAKALRAAGLDPARPPRTIDELDRYADALTTRDGSGRVMRTGYLPVEPDWWVAHSYFYFGGKIFDESSGRFTLTDPRVVRAFEWIQGYAKRFGPGGLGQFRSGLGNMDSPQNPFLSGQLMMTHQGPWMPNYIEYLRPEMQHLLWSHDEEMSQPPADRKKNYAWAAAPFPTESAELQDVAYAGFDTLVIPRGARHKKEAFEFIAYVNRQDVMERLCKMHGKNSPLAKVSDDFLTRHPNPYIDVFERLARSPNARGVPQIPIWPEVADELNVVAQRVAGLSVDPRTALQEAQDRLQGKYDSFMRKQRQRRGEAPPTKAEPIKPGAGY